jgi:hypothetical protein
MRVTQWAQVRGSQQVSLSSRTQGQTRVQCVSAQLTENNITLPDLGDKDRRGYCRIEPHLILRASCLVCRHQLIHLWLLNVWSTARETGFILYLEIL